jgi:hypothetical protein
LCCGVYSRVATGTSGDADFASSIGVPAVGLTTVGVTAEDDSGVGAATAAICEEPAAFRRDATGAGIDLPVAVGARVAVATGVVFAATICEIPSAGSEFF